MRYKTHLATTFAVAIPIMESTESLSVAAITILALGTVSPDIDEPNSYIGNKLKGLSTGVKRIFGHRGITHSLLGFFLFSCLCYFILESLSLPTELAHWFGFGYMAHLIEDSFSTKGIAWFQPISRKSIQSGLNMVYYRTGGFIESLIGFLAVAFILYEVIYLSIADFSTIDWHTMIPTWK